MRFIILAASLALAAPAAEIPPNSHALLRMVNSISTRTAREGDYVYFRTATPIAAHDSIVVPADSYVQGVVTHSVRSGRVKGRAELAIRIESLTLPSGKVVKLNPTLASVDSGEGDQKVVGKENEIKQGTSHGQDAVKIT